MNVLTLARLRRSSTGALVRPEIGCKPMSVAVLDLGGHPLVFKREDGSGICDRRLHTPRRWGTLEWHRGRALADRAASHPASLRRDRNLGRRIAPYGRRIVRPTPAAFIVGRRRHQRRPARSG